MELKRKTGTEYKNKIVDIYNKNEIMIIYKTTNKLNDKIYIGQDKNNNTHYFGSGKKLQKAIKKYGKENFTKEILEECVDESHMNEREVYWILFYNSQDREIGYNISDGSKEGDRKIGQNIAKNGIYNHWVEKYGKEEADKRHEEWRLKISKFQQYKLKNGWKHSDETKEKISQSRLGKKLSEETKNKMRKPKPKGFSEKLSQIKKGISTGPSKRRKEVEQLDLNGNFIKSWESITKVEKELKIYNINAVCKGKQETAGGYKWQYKIKENE